ncbi:MAG: hypothetical protein U0746_17670 [Gemmataceae bacterium]
MMTRYTNVKHALSMPLLLTRLTAWLALLFYAMAVAVRRERPRSARRLWSAGLGAMAVHVVCAFGFMHAWSHAGAAEFTDRQTLALTGVDFRGGLWVNYAFLILWLADVAWWWIDARSYESRPRAVEWGVQAVFAFLFVNAAIVFASGVGRWLGVATFAALAAKWSFATRRQPL